MLPKSTHGRARGAGTAQRPTQRTGVRAAALGVATLMLCAGCTIPTAAERGKNAGSSTPSVTTSRNATPLAPATITPEQRTKMRSAWNEFRKKHPGEMSVSILPVGADQDVKPIVLGQPASRIAGGTLRAPVALAASTFLKEDAQLVNSIVASLNSDNAEAAKNVWEALGSGTEAAQKTMKVLRLTGDKTTRVRSTDPENTTNWSLPAQARFTSGLACMADAALVRDSLHAGIPDMTYGFATDGLNLTLSGWVTVPGAENNMVARQIAIVDQGKAGFSAIAVSVKAPDGTRKSAEKLLTTLARWLHNNTIVPAGRCP